MSDLKELIECVQRVADAQPLINVETRDKLLQVVALLSSADNIGSRMKTRYRMTVRETDIPDPPPYDYLTNANKEA